jgi:hypothetical protein
LMKEGSDPGPYLKLTDPDPGGPKTYGSYKSGSATLLIATVNYSEYPHG